MDTNVFKALLEIEESKCITHAAKHLFVSQPALTKQLRKIEKELGFQIFDRTHTPIRATAQGEVFLEFVRKYSDLEDELHRELGLTKEPTVSPVKIAMTHRGGSYIGSHTASLMKKHENIHLEYFDMSSCRCEEALENEDVDLAVYTDPVLNSNLEYMPIEEDPLVFVVPNDSVILKELDLANNSLMNPVKIPVNRFRDPSLRYVLSTPGQGLYYAENAFFKKYHIKTGNYLRVDYVDTRYQVACSGCGIVLLPHMTIRTQNKIPAQKMIYGLPDGNQMYRYIIAARKKGRKLSQEAEMVWRFLINQRFANSNSESE